MGYTTKYGKDQLDRVALRIINGEGREQARKAEGVSHTPAEIHMFQLEWFAAELPQPGTGEWTFSNGLAAWLRICEEWGVGRIMVALDATEGQVRKAIREHANISDRGIRVGKGGRFYADEPKLYEDTLKATGTQLALDSELSIQKQAKVQKLMKMEFTELKAMAIEAGLIKKGARVTPAKLAMMLANA